MTDFLRELGYSPLRYWLLAAATFLLWLSSALLPWKASGSLFTRLNRPALFGVLLLAAMIAWRWPAILHFKPVNPDEAQFLAGGVTMLARSSIWWIAPTTSGPLVVLPLVLPGLMGLPVDFATGRFVGLFLEWATVFLAYLTLSHAHGDQKARLLVSPLACLMIFLVFWDFVPYCSEPAPVFFCALAAWLCFTAFTREGTVQSRVRLLAGGLILGLIPFSKLQTLPIGAVIGLATLVWIARSPGEKFETIVKHLLTLISGVALGFGLMLFTLWRSGQWNEVYQSYVVHNLHYTQARALPWGESGYLLRYLSGFSWGFASFHYGMLALIAVGLLAFRRAAWRPMLLSWSLLIAAYVSVLVPGRLYPHYLLFLLWPLAMTAGLQFGYLLEGRTRRHYAMWAGLFLLVGSASQLIERVRDANSMHKLIAPSNPRRHVTEFVNRIKKTGDTLAVWGWRPEFYIETQLPQATHEAVTEIQVYDYPQRDYFRTRFVADLRANRPGFFIDSVGPDDFQLTDRDRQSHESVPELREYIAREYSPIPLEGSIRLYVRRDRVPNATGSTD